MSDLLDFTGKVVLVTGSSRGIGSEMIKAFGQRGAQCTVNYLPDAQGQNKAEAMKVADAFVDPLVIDCDVPHPQQVEAMMKQIKEQRGRLHTLVNNFAGINDRALRKMNFDAFANVSPANLI